jgi:hypothetical protein
MEYECDLTSVGNVARKCMSSLIVKRFEIVKDLLSILMNQKVMMNQTDKLISSHELASYDQGYWQVSIYERLDGSTYELWVDPTTGLKKVIENE